MAPRSQHRSCRYCQPVSATSALQRSGQPSLIAVTLSAAQTMCSLAQWKAAEPACPCLQLMFDTVDTVHDCIRIATGVISTIKIFPDKMMAGLSADMLATDLAEYLVRKGECLHCAAQRNEYWLPFCAVVHTASQNSLLLQCAQGRPVTALHARQGI